MRLTKISTFILILLFIPWSSGIPCAAAPPSGRMVLVLQESAVIIWDAKTKTQHFIRSATFNSDSRDFGFLVPTPSVPSLEESSYEIFRSAENWMAPEKIEKNVYGVAPIFVLGAFFLLRSAHDSGPPTAVRILETQQVSGYDAVVLEADNAAALQNWLSEHHYAAPPELTEWFEPYIQQKWKICAFKIAYDSSGRPFETSPVKMSFQTEKPFFPYREPSYQRDKNQGQARVLRIYVLSDSKMDATLGASGSWPGKIIWSDRLDEQQRTSAIQESKIDLPSNVWMTTLEDVSSPRPGTDDLFFVRAKDQNRQHLPPVEVEIDKRIPLPIDLLILLMLIVFLIRRRRRKLRTA